jgi:hypothetical protein
MNKTSEQDETGIPRGELAGEEASRVKSLDVVHRDPQLAVVLTPVVDAHDVRMPQC